MMQKPQKKQVRYDKPSNCEVCFERINFAGSGYVTASGEFVCLSCITILRGDRDDQSYISSSESLRNSKGLVVIQ